jgi:hypothetical protein
LAGRGSYRFLPPFFFPPFAAFFAIVLYPPLRVGFVCEEHSPYRSAAAIWHVGGAPAGARRFAANSPAWIAGEVCISIRGCCAAKKSGVLKLP